MNRMSLKDLNKDQECLIIDGEFKRPQKANEKFQKRIPFSEMKKMDTIELRMSPGDNDLRLDPQLPIIPVLPEGVIKLIFGEMQLLLYFKAQENGNVLLSPHQYDPYGEAPHYFALCDDDYIFLQKEYLTAEEFMDIGQSEQMNFLAPYIYAMQQFTKMRMNREIEIRTRTKASLAGEKHRALHGKRHIVDIGRNITVYTNDDNINETILERRERIYSVSESNRVGHIMHYHKKDGTIGITWRKATTVHYKNTTPDATKMENKTYRFEKPEKQEWQGEKEISEYLTEMNIPFVAQADFHVLPFLGRQTLDFYLPELQLAIEFQGAQHFTPIDHFGGENKLSEQIKRDQIKREKCEKNGIKMIYFADTDVTKLDTTKETIALNYENLKQVIDNRR